MHSIVELWEGRLRVFLTNLAEGEREYREIASLAREISRDYRGRFLLELLQNAADQATDAGVSDSTVTIIRTEQLLAVANAGIPFGREGVERITSIGVSLKNAAVDIGNKGVGFKAVYQVTSSPEIYSASRDDVRGLSTRPATMFRMLKEPFDQPTLQNVLRRLITELPDTEPKLYERLRARLETDEIFELVLAEIRKSAPFKFPLPLHSADFDNRLVELEFPTEALAGSSTLIVLPLLQDPAVEEAVDKALDEFVGTNGIPGSGLLFLAGVGCLVVLDRKRSSANRVVRKNLGRSQDGRLMHVWTGFQTVEEQMVGREWWTLSNTLGEESETIDSETASQQRDAIRAATQALEGESWKDVCTGKVTVALPKALETHVPGALLGANGFICIGLPTLDATGSPIWVDARFNGTISRKGIDLITIQYNKLLFDESVRLTAELMSILKTQPDITARRSVTLALEATKGCLSERLWADDGPAHQSVVLGADGKIFLRARDLSLPAEEDVGIFRQLEMSLSDCSSVEEYGFRLPDNALLDNARTLLDRLGAPCAGGEGPSKPYLSRPSGKSSLLEVSARYHRYSGPVFWEPFMNWLTDRFSVEELKDQKVLPIAGGGLADSDSRVFLSRTESSTSSDDEEIETGGLSDTLRRALHFLDENAIPVIQAEGRSRTTLARKLAPELGGGLVRRPRIEELLNHVLAPQLRLWSKDPQNQELILVLFRQAVTWIRRVHTIERVQTGGLRVPASGEDGAWTWLSPVEAYFGKGWLDDQEKGREIESLLEQAYGQTRKRLVSWDVFARELKLDDEDRPIWVEGLERMGVRFAPRIVSERHRVAPLQSSRSGELVRVSLECPISGVERFWNSYVEDIRRRSVRSPYRQGYGYDVADLCWIDGLENDAARQSVFDLMMRNPKLYESRMSTSLRRVQSLQDPSAVATLWVHALSTADWTVVPASFGGRPVIERRLASRKVWRLSADDRSKGVARLLQAVPATFEGAFSLLDAVGVKSLSDGSAERLVDTLQDLAESLGTLPAEKQRDARSLAHELYRRLQHVCSQQNTDLSAVAKRPMPMLTGRQLLCAVNLGNADIVIYVADDPERERHIPNWESRFRIPLSSRTRFRSLVEALRGVMSDSRVIVASEAPVSTGFEPDQERAVVELLEYLAENLHDPDIGLHIALLIAYGEEREQSEEDASDEEVDESSDSFDRQFHATWKRLSSASLRFGRFSIETNTRAFYDKQKNELQVEAGLSSQEVLKESSRLAPNRRDVWGGYVRARTGDAESVRRFFAEHSIGEIEIENVEDAIGHGDRRFLRNLQPCFLAAWMNQRGPSQLETFLKEWDREAKNVDSISRWITADGLAARLHDLRAARLDDIDASLALLPRLGIQPTDWQDARQSLGLPRYMFVLSGDRFKESCGKIVLALRSLAARSPSVSLERARYFIESVQCVPVPHLIMESPPEDSFILKTVIQEVHRIWSAFSQGDRDKMALLGMRIEALQADSALGIHEIRIEGSLQREEDLYRDWPEGSREEQANQEVEGILRLAVDLASTLGEAVDGDKIRNSPRVHDLTHGWWANKFAALAALRDTLNSWAPETVKRLTDQRAFHGSRRPHELRGAFTGLSPSPGSPPPPPPPPSRSKVLGHELTRDELTSDLGLGSAGTIGGILATQADSDLDFSRFAGARMAVQRPSQTTISLGHWGGGGFGGSSRDRDLEGLLGEAYLYEILHKNLPDFSDTCWMSSNRTKYGLAGEGNDNLGYDFRYRDTTGKLTVVPDRICLIECKATSSDGSQAFPMSVKEWEVAAECYHKPDGPLYIIARVAHISDRPTLVDLIRDPFDLYRKGVIQKTERDLWIYVDMPATERVI